jgi:tetratricopeptide (TPR) repeat protein
VLGTDTSAATLDLRRQIAKFDYELGEIYQQRGEVDHATGYYQRSNREYAAIRTDNPSDRDTLLGDADTLDRLGDLHRNGGKIDDAYDNYEAARAQRERATSLANGNPAEEVEALSKSHVKLGSVFQARGESAHAMVEYNNALHQREGLLAKQPDNVEYQEQVLEVRTSIAELQKQLGEDAAAIDSYKIALPLTEVLLRRDPTNTTWQRQQSLLQAGLGFALLDEGDFRAGLDALDLAIAGQRILSARDPKSTTWQVDLSRSYTRAGDGHLYLGEIDAGVAEYQLALDIRKALLAKEPASVPFRRSLAWSYAKLANAYTERGDVAHATEAHDEALAIRKQLSDASPASSGYKNELASTEIEYGRLLLPKDGKRAAEMIAAGVSRARVLVDGDPINFDWKETLTQGLTAQAAVAHAAGDRKAERAALTEALAVAEPAAEHAGQNAHWPGFLAEIHAGLADAATDPAVAAAEWKRARAVLAPVAAAGRLPASRKALLARVMAH